MSQIAEDLRYTNEHEWARRDGDVVTVGITDYAQDQLGDIVFVELPAPGTTVQAMSEFGTVEAVKTVSPLYAPMTGEILEVNAALETHPEYVNEEPYGRGWMIKVKARNPDEYDTLLTAQAYRELVGA